MNEFQVGRSITISPNQKFNKLNVDEESGCKIITIPGMVLFNITGIYPIRQYQHTIALARVMKIMMKSNSHGEVYTAVYFNIVETKNNLMDAWDQIFTLDGTNSGIDQYEDSKDSFIPGADASSITRDMNMHSGRDTPYRRSVESDEIRTRRHADRDHIRTAPTNLPDDFWK